MELTANAAQTIAANSNVLFTETAVPGNCSIHHREGSGLVTLRGISPQQCRARFRVTFGGNIALPIGSAAVTPISLAIAVNGEPVATTTMITTPAAENEYNNVFSSIFLDVPKNCCYQISVKNTSPGPISAINSNLIVERVA